MEPTKQRRLPTRDKDWSIGVYVAQVRTTAHTTDTANALVEGDYPQHRYHLTQQRTDGVDSRAVGSRGHAVVRKGPTLTSP